MAAARHWHWTWARLDELPARALHEALALRCRVFVVEQRCAYQEVDDADTRAWHLLGRGAPGGPLLATLRVVDRGVQGAEPAIGRVVIAPEARGAGAGQALMREGMARCQAVWPGQAIRLSAQAHLQGFYGALGFQAVSPQYVEDGIPHIDMLCHPTTMTRQETP
ncbi:GNAT family N-acetyltransferase [Pulveribacter suum]|uniref:GNAT family N-acetyltransferase n=1 Tax=Pulveribacter suum TaxID=2116657 RepID=A0A2P1NM25_9BURK|nr:GNAT family N-acetyltransferase [Pulveribacter suum]AVP58114.1 GNAT family N-acetyltransferase [Pulveribacter suum]